MSLASIMRGKTVEAVKFHGTAEPLAIFSRNYRTVLNSGSYNDVLIINEN